jgi:hypothetical protein
VENVKKTILDTTTIIHYSTHQVGGKLELDATPFPLIFLFMLEDNIIMHGQEVIILHMELQKRCIFPN